MALAIASTSTISFMNPVQAVATRVAEVSIVGLDKRAIRTSLSGLSPLRTITDAVSRASQRIVMEAADAPPKKVGDFGFDPLGLSSSDNFAYYREAEIKHGRLAMLAAVAWPLQEILHPVIVDAVRQSTGLPLKDVLVESGGASPSLLNGGLFQAEVLPALLLFTAGCAALERSDLRTREALGCSWNEYPNSFGTFGRQPGDFQFDPLNLYRPLNSEEKVGAQATELMNGRVAMVAVASYVATEFLFDTTVVQATPALFEPIILWPGFRALMDASFGMASMDGSINGIAY